MNLRRSSIGLHSFQGIRGPPQMRKSVNHVIRMNCQLCLEKDMHVQPGDIGNTLFRRDGLHIHSERVVDCLQGSLFEVNVSEVIVHEGDEPDSFVDFFDSDPLTGEHG